ncbi:MAG: hypothetical protein IPQ09_25200, partial [Myxococcales bacterium]|nr:hypothetical protein [Myxococcales bacterium]
RRATRQHRARPPRCGGGNRLDADAARVDAAAGEELGSRPAPRGWLRPISCWRRAPGLDIATGARPEDVRQLFRNCRIIQTGVPARARALRQRQDHRGRHLPAEAAGGRRTTPRGPAHPQRQRLQRGPRRRALRRDSTINALFYVPRAAPGARLVRQDERHPRQGHSHDRRAHGSFSAKTPYASSAR